MRRYINNKKKQLIFTYRSCLYVFCITPLMHTSFYLMVRGPTIQQTHLLSFFIQRNWNRWASESYKYHCFGDVQSLFWNGHGDGVRVCLVPFSRWDDDQQMVGTICGVFISINELWRIQRYNPRVISIHFRMRNTNN